MNVPVATNCCVAPFGIAVVCGVIERKRNTAGPTVIVADAVSEPFTALIVVIPAVRALARPVVEMVAIDGADELHTDEPVRS